MSPQKFCNNAKSDPPACPLDPQQLVNSRNNFSKVTQNPGGGGGHKICPNDLGTHETFFKVVFCLNVRNVYLFIFCFCFSGLDATSSLELLNHLHLVAESGRLVILTIHQPRLEIFHLFHKILLLCDGQVRKVPKHVRSIWPPRSLHIDSTPLYS